MAKNVFCRLRGHLLAEDSGVWIQFLDISYMKATETSEFVHETKKDFDPFKRLLYTLSALPGLVQ